MEINKAGAPPVPVYTNFSGRIGENPANMSVNEIGDSVQISGSVGNRMVNIQEYRASSGMGQISGYVWGGGKHDNVSIWVNGFGDNKSLSGTIGADRVNVQEQSFGNRTHISGWIGQKWINVYADRFASSSVSLQGSVGGDAASSVYLTGFQSPAGAEANYEGIIPALIYTKRDK